MSQRTDKALHAFNLAVGVVLGLLLVGGVGILVYENRSALLPKVGNAGANRATPGDTQSAIKAAFEKMSREVQERSAPPPPPGGWSGGWKK